MARECLMLTCTIRCSIVYGRRGGILIGLPIKHTGRGESWRGGIVFPSKISDRCHLIMASSSILGPQRFEVIVDREKFEKELVTFIICFV